MSGHTFHPELRGYDEQQVLVDGCPECEHRAEDLGRALEHMDTVTFERFWRRIVANERELDMDGQLVRLSACERRVGTGLYAVILQLERRGIDVVVGPPKAHIENVRDAMAAVFGEPLDNGEEGF